MLDETLNAKWSTQEEATSGLEQWEMVVGAARLYDWSGGSRLRSPRASLQRGLSGDSQAADTLRTRERPLPIPGHMLTPALVLSPSKCLIGSSLLLLHSCSTTASIGKQYHTPHLAAVLLLQIVVFCSWVHCWVC